MTGFLKPNEVFESARLRFSALDAANLEAMSSWLPAALAPEWELANLASALESGDCLLISDAANLPVGVAVVQIDAPGKGEVNIPFLAIDPARRFRGLGGEAGVAIERYLREKHGVGRSFAPVPDGRGLAVYFWLRAGYRPLLQVESPGALRGLTAEPVRGIWMVRDEA